MGTLSKLRRMVLRENVSVREAARRLRISRNTAAKWLNEPEMVEPRYPQRAPAPSLLDPYREQLASWLKTDSYRGKRERRSVRAYFEAIRAMGFTGSKNLVYGFCSNWRQEQANAPRNAGFVPLSFELGEAFQFDWSCEYVVIAGLRRRLEVAHTKLVASRAFVLVAYFTQSHEMLFDAHNIACAEDALPGETARPVRAFIEKPPQAQAESLLLQGGHFWNAGIFLVRAGSLLAELQTHAPDILADCRAALAQGRTEGAAQYLEPVAFARCRAQSIDYAVLEKSQAIAMVPFSGMWSDVGSWTALAELSPADAHGNRLNGKAHAIDASNTYIHAPHRQVVALGTHDLLIVDTPDALLVASADRAEQVRQVVSQLGASGNPVVHGHRSARRPWGVYDRVDEGHRFQVKRITVNPGAKLSLQLHHHRAEHWVVVSGTARVTRGEEVFLLSENQSTYIPLGTRHRLENPGHIPLEMIEVQSGSYLGEDDIVRFDDSYGRTTQP